ncbi:hypothetical protein [Streptomyces nogalater]|uniref:Uncharacterized protein n=1 Tax=Streptomyces nogalater TaxID=38314 RepID=A0ABW0WLC9_STRNO
MGGDGGGHDLVIRAGVAAAAAQNEGEVAAGLGVQVPSFITNTVAATSTTAATRARIAAAAAGGPADEVMGHPGNLCHEPAPRGDGARLGRQPQFLADLSGHILAPARFIASRRASSPPFSISI